ncbi:MAG: hemolysin [Clostridia bacterium]|jgi:hemolysin III|nr:hemolysin [Clostridiales bacterium]MDK2985118.1 hemolysin [Clostridia bacterium]
MLIAKMKDPVSALTHLLGIVLAIIGLVILLYFAAVKATVWHIVSFAVFGSSMILLYTASTLYHSLKLSEKGTKILRKVDHMMIYVLIAGTYTPVTLIPLRGAWGWSLFGSIWAIAVAGILLKVFWFDAPRWFSTLFYTVMGWLVVIAFYPLMQTVPPAGISWLVAGGTLYTIGAVIYGTKWPKITSQVFGFHEIFHLFVLGGSFCHFWFMIKYVLYL